MESLADFLGVALGAPAEPTDTTPHLEDITDSKAFALAVLGSREFRAYIVNSLNLGDLPSAVLCRLMDYGWGKPVDRVEHTGKDGQPIETVTEVRRVIVRVEPDIYDRLAQDEQQKSTTH